MSIPLWFEGMNSKHLTGKVWKREDRLGFEVRKRTAELENIILELIAQNLELRSIQQRLEEDQRAL
jgi:hypothetical protein